MSAPRQNFGSAHSTHLHLASVPHFSPWPSNSLLSEFSVFRFFPRATHCLSRVDETTCFSSSAHRLGFRSPVRPLSSSLMTSPVVQALVSFSPPTVPLAAPTFACCFRCAPSVFALAAVCATHLPCCRVQTSSSDIYISGYIYIYLSFVRVAV